jgi:phage shock protein A
MRFLDFTKKVWQDLSDIVQMNTLEVLKRVKNMDPVAAYNYVVENTKAAIAEAENDLLAIYQSEEALKRQARDYEKEIDVYTERAKAFKAAGNEAAALQFAQQLVNTQKALEKLRADIVSATEKSAQAKRLVDAAKGQLQQLIINRESFLLRLKAAKLAEQFSSTSQRLGKADIGGQVAQLESQINELEDQAAAKERMYKESIEGQIDAMEDKKVKAEAEELLKRL